MIAPPAAFAETAVFACPCPARVWSPFVALLPVKSQSLKVASAFSMLTAPPWGALLPENVQELKVVDTPSPLEWKAPPPQEPAVLPSNEQLLTVTVLGLPF